MQRNPMKDPPPTRLKPPDCFLQIRGIRRHDRFGGIPHSRYEKHLDVVVPTILSVMLDRSSPDVRVVLAIARSPTRARQGYGPIEKVAQQVECFPCGSFEQY